MATTTTGRRRSQSTTWYIVWLTPTDWCQEVYLGGGQDYSLTGFKKTAPLAL